MCENRDNNEPSFLLVAMAEMCFMLMIFLDPFSSACVYVYHMHAGTQRGYKMALGPLELEFQMVVSYQVEARNQIRVLGKTNKCSLPPRHLSSPVTLINVFLSWKLNP